jgi:hypothetical protein
VKESDGAATGGKVAVGSRVWKAVSVSVLLKEIATV